MTHQGLAREGMPWEHRVERRRLLPAAFGQPCPMCNRVMHRVQRLDLDHLIPRALGGANGPRRIVHASCNRRAGAELGRRLARARAQLSRSRDW